MNECAWVFGLYERNWHAWYGIDHGVVVSWCFNMRTVCMRSSGGCGVRNMILMVW